MDKWLSEDAHLLDDSQIVGVFDTYKEEHHIVLIVGVFN